MSEKMFFRDRWLLVVFPLAKIWVHLLTMSGYGIFRDELYYIACSKRLAWGYVDHPPLSVALLRLVRETLGDELWALRLLPALAGAAVVLLIGSIARRLGGGTLAQCLAMTVALLWPTLLGVSHVYSMNVFDCLIWALAAYLVIRLVDESSLGLWLILGTVLGLGLLNKISVLWLGLGLAVGLLLTGQRRKLLGAGPWLAAGVSGLIFLPHVLWQIHLGWPTREFIRQATEQKMVATSAAEFVTGQVDMLGGPVLFFFAAAGLGFLMFSRRMARFRILGWMYLTVFVLLLLAGSSRAGYLAPASCWLLAMGGVAWESWLGRLTGPGRRLAQAGLLGLLVLSGALTAPFGLPILPVETFITYSRALGVEPATEERKSLAELPQFYADMFGWREKAEAASRAALSLSPSDLDKACFFAGNYGVAGAIEFLAGADMPPVISSHNNFWLWGPGQCSGEVMIFLGGDRQDLEAIFAEVQQVDTIECGFCMPYENHQPVHVTRRPRADISAIWPSLKHYD